jgi:hypothetical protein
VAQAGERSCDDSSGPDVRQKATSEESLAQSSIAPNLWDARYFRRSLEFKLSAAAVKVIALFSERNRFLLQVAAELHHFGESRPFPSTIAH